MHSMQRRMARCGIAAIFAIGLFFHSEPMRATEPTEDALSALVLKVEGDGIAQVRKRSGVMAAAGARGRVFAGDKIITDGRSAVHLLLHDGSVIKIGFNSEFALEKVENQGRFLSWLFQLAKGSVRALVEKNPSQETRIEMSTKSGTIGVRGTEFVYAFDPGSETSFLYMLEGLVWYGQKDCAKAKSCVEVRGGEQSSMVKGQAKPAAPQKLNPSDLFGLKKEGDKAVAGPDADARASLFKDAKLAQGKALASMDEAALGKIVQEARDALAAAQDRAMGRSKELRLSMHDAIKSGAFDDTLEAGAAYAEARGVFHHASNKGAEDLLAQTAVAKYRLGEAVKRADTLGLFADKPKTKDKKGWLRREFKMRKLVGYEQGAEAKQRRQNLDRALAEYHATLEYVEALNARQAEEARRAMELQDKSSRDSTTSYYYSTQYTRATNPDDCKDLSCSTKRLNYETNASSEGVVSAYSGTRQDYGGYYWSRPERSGTSINTNYFSKTVTSSTCFQTIQDCKVQPCSGYYKGKKCKVGESVQVCTSKQIPVRCK